MPGGSPPPAARGAPPITTETLASRDAFGPLRYRRLWNALGVGFVLLVVYLSLARPPRDLQMPRAFDYGHVVAYFWLMIWFAQIHRTGARRWLLAAAFGALGIVLELIQGQTGYRQFDYADMIRNFVGIGLGLALAHTGAQNVLRRIEQLLNARRR